jgi:uncharacterized protein YodC (DUF2158 family)
MSDPSTFAVGDLVMMVGGSVRMTVAHAITPQDVVCRWFDVHAQLQTARFEEALLRKWTATIATTDYT